MKRVMVGVAAVLLCAALAYSAEKPQIAGKWDMKSVDEAGNQQSWALTVSEEKGKLSGTVEGGENHDRYELIEPKLDGDTFSFSILVGDVRVDASLKVDGKKLQGSYSSGGMGNGTISGARQS